LPFPPVIAQRRPDKAGAPYSKLDRNDETASLSMSVLHPAYQGVVFFDAVVLAPFILAPAQIRTGIQSIR
jgi:hypothetical protein